MLLQVTYHVFLLVMIASRVQSNQNKPKFCAECEEEVWEEVPCDQVYPSSPTTVVPTLPTKRPILIPTTQAPITPPPTTPVLKKAPTLSSIIYPITTAAPPIYATIKDSTLYPPESNPGYKKCYCECKAGCREFCRKVELYPESNKQIVQLSKTIHDEGNKKVEVKHLHERNFVLSPPSPPLPDGISIKTYNQQEQLANLAYLDDNINVNPYTQQQQQPLVSDNVNINPYNQQQRPSKLAYTEPKATNNPPPNPPPTIVNNALPYEVSSLGFSPEEISRLLNSDQEYSNVKPKIARYSPIRNQAALPNPLQVPLGYNPSVASALPATGCRAAVATEKAKNNYKGAQQTSFVRPPYPRKYKDNLLSQSALQNLEPAIDNYLRDVLYLNQNKGSRGYGYSQ